MSSRRGFTVALTAFTAAALAAVGACFSDKDAPPTAGPSGALVECGVALDTIPAGHVIVAMKNFVFIPDSVRVSAGTTITWVNCDDPAGSPSAVDHTSTADDGTWDSGLFSPGEKFSREFSQTGSFPYHCIPHRGIGMVGTVVVE